MAYTSGNIIRKGDFNLLATGAEDGTYDATVPNLGVVWGTGFGRFGYGQIIEDTIDPVATGDAISAAQWDNLDAIISNVIEHQLGPGNYPDNSPVAPGQLISPIARLQPGVQLAYSGVGKCFAPDETQYNTTFSGLWGGAGRRTLKFTQTLTFESADIARYFFNAGGKIKLNFSYTPNPMNDRASVWENITQSAGVVTIGYQDTIRTGGSPEGFTVRPAGQGGYWAQSTGVALEHFRQIANPTGRYEDIDGDGFYGSYGYSGYGYGYGYGYYESPDDYLKVEVKVTDTDGLNQNIGKVVTITTSLVNGSIYAPAGDTIQGSFTTGLIVSKPPPPPPRGPGLLTVDHWSDYIFSGEVDAVA